VRPKLSWKTCYKTLVNDTLKGHQTPQFRLCSLLPLQEVLANNAKGVDVNYIKISEAMLIVIITIVSILDHLLLKNPMVAGPPMCPTPLMQVKTLSPMI
jgi:hypothetical protein